MSRRLRTALDFFAVFSLPALWWGGIVLGSLGVMASMSFWTQEFPTFRPDFQFGNYEELLTNNQYVVVIARSVRIALMSCLFSFLIGFPLVYFIVFKVESRAVKLLLYMGMLIPLWVSYVLRSYTWKTILGTEGVLNSALLWLGIVDEPVMFFLYNQYAMVITIGYICMPLMMLPIYSSLDKIPRSLIEASRDLGANSFHTFLNVTLRLAIPGIIAGWTLAFCLAVGDFVSPILVGGPSANMIANVVLTQYGMALNWPLGAAITVVLLVIFVILLSASNQAERVGKVNIE
ncbi:MAG: ABC transporter permease [Alphaproteobacteria bacterium]|nr:ABC transporter permease [Alphaproteobacteria bacterium]MCY4608320.1 ABC transporter permease [bacterium]